jgi:hypothetical protein
VYFNEKPLTTYINTITEITMSKAGLIPRIADNIKSAETQDDKLAILSKYHNETLVKRILKYAYNPMIDFGMNEFQPKNMGKEDGMGMSKFMHILEEIIEGKFDQKESVFAANLALGHMNDEEAPIFVGILKKDLDWGLEIETINRVWEKLVHEYPVQTATEATPELLSKLEFPCVVQYMSSGIRVNIIVKNNEIKFKDKHGNNLPFFDDFAPQFQELAQFGSVVFDGHALLVDDKNVSIGATDQQIIAREGGKLKFMLWDLIRYDGFIQGADTRLGYNWRYNGIEHMMLLTQGKIEDPCFLLPTSHPVKIPEHAMGFVEKINSPVVIKSLANTWSGGYTTQELIVRK